MIFEVRIASQPAEKFTGISLPVLFGIYFGIDDLP